MQWDSISFALGLPNEVREEESRVWRWICPPVSQSVASIFGWVFQNKEGGVHGVYGLFEFSFISRSPTREGNWPGFALYSFPLVCTLFYAGRGCVAPFEIENGFSQDWRCWFWCYDFVA